ncbi:MAG: aldo/keto reductase [Chloroflexi bacterium]|nr:aldo/keto reductase [Chloroflexota bacterium]OJV92506.1 MAG: aldo/keto reductase [Chloroflexi bacterium 54-19]
MQYKLLGRTGLFVSELCLGTMTFGGGGVWQAIGSLGQPEVNNLVDRAIEAGINFFDTANVYSAGESERLLGEALKGRRQDVVLATKVRGRVGPGPNQIGLSRGHIMQQIDGSLKRLQTDYIDLYQIHGFDIVTPIEETMRALDDLVKAGKVRYIGCSNLAAWQILKANGFSDKQNTARFETLQAYYSLAGRELERELIPALTDQQMGLLVWSPLAGGFLSGRYTRENQTVEGSRRTEFDFPPVNKDKGFDIIAVLQEIGQAHDVSVARIALAWLLHQQAVTSVIIGAKTLDQLNDNLQAPEIKLSADELERIDKVSALAPEYPGWMIARQNNDRVPR